MSANIEDPAPARTGLRWLGVLIRFAGPVVLVAAGVLGATGVGGATVR